MSHKPFTQRIWVFVLAGVMMGLLIAAGFEVTNESGAKPFIASNETAPAPAPSPAPNPQDLNVAEQLSNAFAAAAQDVNPSVVMVFTETTIKSGGMGQDSPFRDFFGDDFFKRFFEGPGGQQEQKRQGLGSGVIVAKNGIIVTNNHVVKDADNIKVRLLDGREFDAKVKGTDPRTDLAVITIDADNLPPIKFGNSENQRVGDWVLAIGSPLNPQLEHTVTSGIISAKGRSGVGLSYYEDYIQTDAAINPGNSGGALVNLKGELIGINSAIATQTGGFMGIGFAIPSNLVRKVMDDLIEKGKVVRGWLGVGIQNVTPQLAEAMNLSTPQGVLVTSVQKKSPAEKAGLKAEDVIMSFNGEEVRNSAELSTKVAGTSPGTDITLGVLRDGKEKTIDVKLGELTPEKSQQLAGTSQKSESDVGISVANITDNLARQYKLPQTNHGVVIVSVDPRSVAAQAGLQEGDVILKVNRTPVNSVSDFNKQMDKTKPGENVLFYLSRGNANFFVALPIPE